MALISTSFRGRNWRIINHEGARSPQLEIGVRLEWRDADIRADVSLAGAVVDVVVDLRKDEPVFVGVSLELWEGNDVVRLASSLLDRVINQDGVRLVPSATIGIIRMAARYFGRVPKGC